LGDRNELSTISIRIQIQSITRYTKAFKLVMANLCMVGFSALQLHAGLRGYLRAGFSVVVPSDSLLKALFESTYAMSLTDSK